MGQAQAAAQQQAFAVDPVGFGQRLDNPLGNRFGTIGVASGVDQQGELVAAQARQLVTRLQLLFQARHHLQDQAVATLVAEGVVDVAEVVQVQVAEGKATAVVLGQTRGQQGLEALAVGDAGQRVLLGQALQGGHQHAALAHMAQRAAQCVGIELVTHQPVADSGGRYLGLVVEQQDGRQLAAPGRGLQGRGCQHDSLAVLVEQAVDRLPVRRRQQYGAATQGRHALA
ncbi:hypothetical protein D3C75_840480 [compost metagenome]